MQIFLKTRIKSEDINWFNTKNTQIEYPEIPESLDKLLDTEVQSLILYRQSKEKLILAITDLKSGRIDNRTRPIRNSLIWIAGDSEDEQKKIRAIIYEYLTAKEELEKKIIEEKVITETPEINIKYEKIESIGDIGDINKVENNDLPKYYLDNKIGNLDLYKQKLIKEMKSCSLPKKDGLLIFITESKSETNVKKENPWRGLSNEIESKEWITLENQKPVENQKKPQTSTSEKSLKNSHNTHGKQSNFLSIALALLLIVSNAFWFYQTNQLNQRINEVEKKINQIENLQSVIDKSKLDVETAKGYLENEILTAKAKFEKTFLQAQEQFNNDISNATTEYETNMNKIKQTLDDSLKKIN